MGFKGKRHGPGGSGGGGSDKHGNSGSDDKRAQWLEEERARTQKALEDLERKQQERNN